jgi:ABC-type transport system involved in multi-copper enzyme maturation permease subunit
MTKQTWVKVFFVVSILVAIGFIIGGIWIPPFYAVGGMLLAGSLGFFQGAFSRKNSEQEADASTPNEVPQTPQNSPAHRGQALTFSWRAHEHILQTTKSGTILERQTSASGESEERCNHPNHLTLE